MDPINNLDFILSNGKAARPGEGRPCLPSSSFHGIMKRGRQEQDIIAVLSTIPKHGLPCDRVYSGRERTATKLVSTRTTDRVWPGARLLARWPVRRDVGTAAALTPALGTWDLEGHAKVRGPLSVILSLTKGRCTERGSSSLGTSSNPSNPT